MLQVYKSTKNRLAALNKSIKNFSFVCRLYRFSKYDFFQVIFDFRFFRIFDGFKIYFLFSLFLSIPLPLFLFLCSSLRSSVALCSFSNPLWYILYISIFNYILPGNNCNYCKRSGIYSPSDFTAVQPFRW